MSKVIVITGGGAGLGLAMARRLAADGHTLFLLGRTLDKVEMAATELGSKVHAVQCDVADPNSVDNAFAEIARYAASVDVLINNAGVFAPFFLAEATNEQIARTLNTNLAGPMYCSRAVLPMMQKGSHIISIGSETVVVTAAMLGAYQASKAGLERFCKTLDQEVSPLGIRVTLIRAGKMYGPEMSYAMDPETAQRFTGESLKLGIDNRQAAISQYTSVAEVIPFLISLPGDVYVPELMMAACRA